MTSAASASFSARSSTQVPARIFRRVSRLHSFMLRRYWCRRMRISMIAGSSSGTCRGPTRATCGPTSAKWKSKMKGITEQAGRDCKAYKLARNYMLGLPGVTDKVLQRYLSIPLSDTPSTMAEVFLRLLLSLRNKGMMATVIPAELVHSLGRVLNSFDPVTATQRFTSADDLLDTIVEKLRPAGQIRRGPGCLWPLFARGTLSGARFLGQFKSGPHFLAWVKTSTTTPASEPPSPLLLSKEIDGFGFALGCDFLKELGFLNFAKPDVHVKAITKGLKLSIETANDYAVFKDVVRIAAHCDKTPYDVDKLFWLVGSGPLLPAPINRSCRDRPGWVHPEGVQGARLVPKRLRRGCVTLQTLGHAPNPGAGTRERHADAGRIENTRTPGPGSCWSRPSWAWARSSANRIKRLK